MEKTLAVLNRMVAEGVIENYAIGGAVGAIYYLEPFDTADLDVFIEVSTAPGNLAILSPIYDYLNRLGFLPSGEFVEIDGLPVQFLPAFNPLISEAVDQARIVTYAESTARIMTAEHLVAIMLNTGRPKDYARIAMFLDAGAVDRARLDEVLSRHQLLEKWQTNRARFE